MGPTPPSLDTTTAPNRAASARYDASDDMARLLAYAIAAARVGLGVTAMAAPGLASRLLAEPGERRPVLRMFTRLVGIRDLALGLATIDALRRRDGTDPADRHESTDRARYLLWLGVVCDVSDGAATIRQPGVPPRSRRLVTAIAWLGAATGAWPATRLSRPR